MYAVLRRILFWFDAEFIHHLVVTLLQLGCRWMITRRILYGFFHTRSISPQVIHGLRFANPVGLAAGFDKNASHLREWQTLGFGFVEIGTVTPLPQSGNERPRLFRLPKDQALINRMGFNNEGVTVIANRLKAWREAPPVLPGAIPLIVGGNIGKNKATANEDAWKDYERCFRELFPWVDYFVVNVSSPNTPGLRALQETNELEKILSHLQQLNRQQPSPKPLLVKIAPDLTENQLGEIIQLALSLQIDGLVIANTTISREGLQTSKNLLDTIGAGGVSGKPLLQRSTQLLEFAAQKSNGKLLLMGSGGIFTAQDAQQKIN
ncbi:MAG: quinone-dependent dihydroorotate dehydrogenase, partial [Chitinophagaceae bacterium]